MQAVTLPLWGPLALACEVPLSPGRLPHHHSKCQLRWSLAIIFYNKAQDIALL